MRGNHDRWHESKVNNMNFGKNSTVEAGKEVKWNLGIQGKNYSFCMSHDPHDFGISDSTKNSTKNEYDPFDVIIYGHSHLPYYRVLNDGKLAIGSGSRFSNYNVMPQIPRRSIQVMQVNSVVDIKHIDFDKEKIAEEKVFKKNGDDFKLLEEWKNWEGGRFR